MSNFTVIFENKHGNILTTGVVLIVNIYGGDRPSYIYMENEENRKRAFEKLQEHTK